MRGETGTVRRGRLVRVADCRRCACRRRVLGAEWTGRTAGGGGRGRGRNRRPGPGSTRHRDRQLLQPRAAPILRPEKEPTPEEARALLLPADAGAPPEARAALQALAMLVGLMREQKVDALRGLAELSP